MIVTIFAYFVLLIAVALYSRHRGRSRGAKNLAFDYFLSGRQLGIFSLAMTTAATYVSASSFIGGPGVAYSRGLAWVFLAAVQYPVSLIIMGIFGQQIRQLGHRHQLYDLADYLLLRYRSRLYSRFCAMLIAIILAIQLMIAIMGGSRLLQGALSEYDISYGKILFIFSLALGVYTLLGGLRAVVLTDILQGAWMLLASLILFAFLWQKAGGANGLSHFARGNPELFQADGGGLVPLSYTLNFTILVGFGMIVQPISFSRLLALEHGQSLRKGILISIAVLGSLVFLPHFIGFLGRIVLPDISEPDQVMGRIGQLFRAPQYGAIGSLFSGMLISAMLAAIMSTADSALNTLGLCIYRHLLPRRFSRFSRSSSRAQTSSSEQRHFRLSRILAALTIVICAILALKPPQLLVTLNLYALGITQVALLWPIVLGILTRRPGAHAAISSSLLGLCSYTALNWLYPDFGGVRLLPYSLLVGLVAYGLTASPTVLFRRSQPKL